METSRRARTRARQAITPMQLPIATNASRILIESFFSPQAGASLLSRTECVKSLSCRTRRPALAEQFDELGGRDRLTGLVISHPFKNCIADAVGDPAMNLAFHDHRIDAAASVLHGDITQELHATGLDVDFDLDGMAGIRIGKLIHTKCRARLKARVDVLGKRIAGCTSKDAGQLGKFD